MRKLILSTVAAIGMATVAVGALNAQGAPAPGTIDLAAVQSGTYTADPAHSMVNFHINHLGFNDYIGIFGDVAGTLTIDKDNIGSAKVDVMIPIASVTVPSAGLKDHLLRPGANGGAPDFFGPTPAPAHFVSTTVTSTGDHTATIVGDLTLNGVTKPVTIEATLSGMGTARSGKATLGFHGRTTIKRSEWNMGFGTAFGIGDDMPLFISVAFEK